MDFNLLIFSSLVSYFVIFHCGKTHTTLDFHLKGTYALDAVESAHSRCCSPTSTCWCFHLVKLKLTPLHSDSPLPRPWPPSPAFCPCSCCHSRNLTQVGSYIACLLWPVYFTDLNAPKAASCSRSRCQNFLPFKGWITLLRVPWTARRSNQSVLKEISPGCSLEGLMLKLKLQFGHLMWSLTHLRKPWCWERLKAGEGDNKG